MNTRRYSKFLAGLGTGLILLSLFNSPAQATGEKTAHADVESGGIEAQASPGSGAPLRANAAAEANFWTYIGLQGEGILSLAIDPVTPTTLYAGIINVETSNSSVFKSTNGGGDWSAVNNGLTHTAIKDLAIDSTNPSTLYAGTTGGVFKSTNGGGNWNAANVGLTNNNVHPLVIDPTNHNTLYAGTMGGGVFKSTNGGENWIAVNSGLPSVEDFHGNIFTLAIDPANPTTLFAGASVGGVFKSTNGGGTWSEVFTCPNHSLVQALAIDPTNTSTVYVGIPGSGLSGVFKSTNGGGTWNAVNNGLANTNVQALALDPTTPGTLYAGTTGGVFKSTDGGGSWSALNNGLTNNDVTALALDPATPSTVYAGTYGGGVFSMHDLKPWTLMFYLDGDNSLYYSYFPKFNQLEAAADNPNVNIVLLWDKYQAESAYYKVQYDTDLNKLGSYPEEVDYWPLGEVDMGSPDTLINYVSFARAKFPAQQYALILADHGNGLGGAMIDVTNQNHLMSVKDIGSALAAITKSDGDGDKKINVLYMDSCLMGMIEDAYQVRDYVDYYVASENISWAFSLPYFHTISGITETTEPAQLASLFVDSYADVGNSDNKPYTISAADMSKLSDLVAATNALAQVLNSQMVTVAPTLTGIAIDVQRFEMNGDYLINASDNYIDLYDFARLVGLRFTDVAIQSAAQGVRNAVTAYINDTHYRSGYDQGSWGIYWDLKGSHGVSVFWPLTASSFYNATNYDFAVGATWAGPAHLASSTDPAVIEWGPMLVNYFQTMQPGGPDDPNPPQLLPPLREPLEIYLPLIAR